MCISANVLAPAPIDKRAPPLPPWETAPSSAFEIYLPNGRGLHSMRSSNRIFDWKKKVKCSTLHNEDQYYFYVQLDTKCNAVIVFKMQFQK